MTAIVGIINRNGVAVAADSAATHTISADNKKKITNHANKIFELSKYRPVGVAICGTLSFMGMPWEDAFKMYRQQLGKKSFPHLTDYLKDLMNYVRTTILPKFEEDQKGQLAYLANSFKNELLNAVREELKEQGKEEDTITMEEVLPLMKKKLEEFSVAYSKREMRIGNDYEGYSLATFISYATEIISSIIKDVLDDGHCPDGFEKIFTESLYNVLVSTNHVYLSTTEIIVYGYGDEDMFPSCQSIKVSASFDGRIKWGVSSSYSVTNVSTAWIIPYAQADVSNTVVRGVDQTLRDKFIDEAKVVLEKLKCDLLNKMKDVGAPEDFQNALLSFDIKPYTDLYENELDQYIKNNYIKKLMDTVSFLMKEDLADMAESLVKMTCLKRHFTTDDETVGGPVDVAVITRGDGFVWIKRKHYFSPDINHHYFERQEL